MSAIIARPCARPAVSTFIKSGRSIAAKPQLRAVRVLAEKKAKPAGHDTRGSSQPEIDEEFKKEIEAYKENEQNAARLTPAEEIRTLVDCAKFGTLSTFASTGPVKGYPLGSVLSYATDDQGRIICALSNLSSHKKDLIADGRATVTVTQNDFKSMADARCTVSGTFEIVPDEERAAARDAYMKVHPDAYWVDYGDFDFHRMNTVAGCNLIAGFGRAFKVSAAEYTAAEADPVAKFSKPICQHMNDDHSDATCAMITHYAGLQVESAEMLSVDRLGITTQCRPKCAPDQQVKVRLSFPELALTRSAVKEQLVAMTRTAAAAAKEEAAAA